MPSRLSREHNFHRLANKTRKRPTTVNRKEDAHNFFGCVSRLNDRNVLGQYSHRSIITYTIHTLTTHNAVLPIRQNDRGKLDKNLNSNMKHVVGGGDKEYEERRMGNRNTDCFQFQFEARPRGASDPEV